MDNESGVLKLPSQGISNHPYPELITYISFSFPFPWNKVQNNLSY